jgi:hypothetical protein
MEKIMAKNYKPESFKESRVTETMSNQDNQRSQRKGVKIFRWLLIIFAVLVLMIAAFSFAVSHDSPGAVTQWLESSKSTLVLWRLLLFSIFIGCWHYWSELYANWTGLSDEQFKKMQGYRWRVAAWLLIMEMIFSQHILSELFARSLTE